MSDPLLDADRSGVSLYYRCARAFYFERIHEGTGIEPVARRLWAVLGSAAHRGLSAAIRAERPDAGVAVGVQWLLGTLAVRPWIATAHYETYVPPDPWPTTGAALVEALIRAWWKTRWPAIDEQYLVLTSEAPLRWPVSTTGTLEIQPDLVLVERRTHLYYPLDFKFTTRVDAAWARMWLAHPQVVAYMAALERAVRVPWRTHALTTRRVGGMIIEAIDRGELRDGKLTSPLVSGFAAAPQVTDIAQMSRARVANTQMRVAVPRHQIRAWVEGRAWGDLVRTVPLPRASDEQVDQYRGLVERHLATVRARREHDLGEAGWPMEGIATGECASPQRRCPYAHLCHPGAFPAIQMQPRDPHHNVYAGDDD